MDQNSALIRSYIRPVRAFDADQEETLSTKKLRRKYREPSETKDGSIEARLAETWSIYQDNVTAAREVIPGSQHGLEQDHPQCSFMNFEISEEGKVSRRGSRATGVSRS